jgi:hypothetical protein
MSQPITHDALLARQSVHRPRPVDLLPESRVPLNNTPVAPMARRESRLGLRRLFSRSKAQLVPQEDSASETAESRSESPAYFQQHIPRTSHSDSESARSPFAAANSESISRGGDSPMPQGRNRSASLLSNKRQIARPQTASSEYDGSLMPLQEACSQ